MKSLLRCFDRPRTFYPLVLAFVVCSGCGSSPQTYLARGNAFAAAGKLDDAVIQYRKALQKTPSLGEAYYRLGKVQLKKNLLFDAYQSFRSASQLMAGNQEVLAVLGDLSLRLYNADSQHPKALYDLAAASADQLLRQNPDSFEGNRLEGVLALVNRKPEEAITFLRVAKKASPNDPETTLGLARALASTDQNEAGLELALELTQTNRAFGASYDFLADKYMSAHRTQDAEDILKLKVANNPNQPDFLIELARFYALGSRQAEMAPTLQRLLNNSADFPDGRLRVADFYASLGKFDEAIGHYREGLKSDPGNELLFGRRLIRALAAERKYPEALQQADATLKAHPDADARLDQALIWLEQGKPENLTRAIAELRAQVQRRPQDPVLHYQLGLALSRNGDSEAARREWVAAGRLNPRDVPSRLVLASLDLSQGRPQDALQVSEEILAVAPNEESRLLNAVCLVRAGRLPEARLRLNRLVSDFPQSSGPQYQLGVLAINERKYKEAEQIFRGLQKTARDNPQVVAGLAESYEGQNHSKLAIQLLQDELKRSPDSTLLRGLLARFAALSGDPDLAIDQYRRMALANPKSAEIRISLGEAYEVKGDYSSAIAIFSNASKLDTKSAMAELKLGGTFVKLGRFDEAKGPYRRALALQPDDARALNNLAFVMLETGDNADEALRFAERGLRSASDPALRRSLTDTVGWAYLKKKRYDDAVQTFHGLVKSNPDNATFHYHLGAALFEKGDQRGARIELENALAAKPSFADTPKIRALLARI